MNKFVTFRRCFNMLLFFTMTCLLVAMILTFMDAGERHHRIGIVMTKEGGIIQPPRDIHKQIFKADGNMESLLEIIHKGLDSDDPEIFSNIGTKFASNGAIPTIQRKHWDYAARKAMDKQLQIYCTEERRTMEVCPCVAAKYMGQKDANFTIDSWASLAKIHSNVERGGLFIPPCKAQQKVAIIIPYKNRQDQLKILLHSLHPFLQRQQLFYRIFVVEPIRESSHTIFNKGGTMDAGFKEVERLFQPDCYIFHDVDLIPLDDRNLYLCNSHSPLHLGVQIDKWGFQLMYDSLLGGVIAFSREQFEMVNGFSLLFYGWGGEDDDLYSRISHHKMSIERYSHPVSIYSTIKHQNDKIFQPNMINMKQYLNSSLDSSGLSTIRYDVETIVMKPLYTHIKYVLDTAINNFTAIRTFSPCENNIVGKVTQNLLGCATSCLKMADCNGFFFINRPPCLLLKRKCVGIRKNHNAIFYLKNPVTEENLIHEQD